jgi:hypothetical protein
MELKYKMHQIDFTNGLARTHNCQPNMELKYKMHQIHFTKIFPTKKKSYYI